MHPSTASRTCCPLTACWWPARTTPARSALALRTREQGNTRVVLYGTSDDADLRLDDGGPGKVGIYDGRQAGSRSHCRSPDGTTR